MVKCPCGKEIIFKRCEMVEIDEEEDESTVTYSERSHLSYREIPQSERKMKKTRIYGCPNEYCRYTSDMTEDQYHELEDNESDNDF
ncbi:MAG: hypothetical protein ABSA75_06545 [Candidatus Bathyarchaeia archaeon]|jgi:hypothetical protein